QYVWLDRFTVRNLELHHSPHQNGVSLLEVIDHTRSPMGGRLLKRWLALPLKQLDRIQDRHQVVAHLTRHGEELTKAQHWIKQMGDLERLISKLATGKINPKEVILLKNSLEALQPIKQWAESSSDSSLKELGQGLEDCQQLRSKIKEVLNEGAPVNLAKGSTIAQGYSQELDELRELAFS